MDSPGSIAFLQVSNDGLHAHAAWFEAAADELIVNSPPAGAVASWSASALAVSAAHAQITTASMLCTSRVRVRRTKLAAAATGYAENEESSAAQLRALYRPTVC